jgi:CubicO group peptidase (beta-lactamase class C family)
MKRLNYIFGFTLILLLASCHVGRFFIWNFSEISDHKKFQNVSVERDPSKLFKFHEGTVAQKAAFAKMEIEYWDQKMNIEAFMEKSNSVAFMIIRNDSILYENYFNKYDTSSLVNSFSMAKSYTSALLGIAIEEGKVKSVNDPITDYLPELIDEGFKKVTIEHVLDMRAGIDYSENYYNPFGNVAVAYYGRNLWRHVKKLKIGIEPDARFDYISINTQLLGLIVERATGKKLSAYLEEKIWKPLGMEYDASWSIDSKKHATEKAFCCINARARDFAKFGRLYLNKGKWNGQQLVPKAWVDRSTMPTMGTKTSYYSYQWWINASINKGELNPNSDYTAQGHLGQFIYVSPDNNTILIRLGKNNGKVRWMSLLGKIAKRVGSGKIN